MVFPLRIPRLRRLLLAGALAAATGVVVSGPGSPARAQTNPYCYAPYYNPYYCQYYSYYGYNYPYYNYGYPYYSYGYGYPAYPNYGIGVAPFALGFGIGVGGGYYAHRGVVGREFHRGFAGRTFHGAVPHSVHRGIAGGSPHVRAGGFHPSPVQRSLTPMFDYAHHH